MPYHLWIRGSMSVSGPGLPDNCHSLVHGWWNGEKFDEQTGSDERFTFANRIDAEKCVARMEIEDGLTIMDVRYHEPTIHDFQVVFLEAWWNKDEESVRFDRFDDALHYAIYRMSCQYTGFKVEMTEEASDGELVEQVVYTLDGTPMIAVRQLNRIEEG